MGGKELSSYTFNSVKCVIDGKVILDRVSGVCDVGRMTAILGPSGSGKTSLIDVLSGRKSIGKVTGLFQIDGRTIGKEQQKSCIG